MGAAQQRHRVQRQVHGDAGLRLPQREPDLAYVIGTMESLAPYLRGLNRVRREHPALQLLRNVTIHSADDENVLVFSKKHGDDVVIVVVNLDPHGTRETTVHLNLPALGMGWHDTFAAYDEITEQTWNWKEHNYVRLDPWHEPAHILSVRKP